MLVVFAPPENQFESGCRLHHYNEFVPFGPRVRGMSVLESFSSTFVHSCPADGAKCAYREEGVVAA